MAPGPDEGGSYTWQGKRWRVAEVQYLVEHAFFGVFVCGVLYGIYKFYEEYSNIREARKYRAIAARSKEINRLERESSTRKLLPQIATRRAIESGHTVQQQAKAAREIIDQFDRLLADGAARDAFHEKAQCAGDAALERVGFSDYGIAEDARNNAEANVACELLAERATRTAARSRGG